MTQIDKHENNVDLRCKISREQAVFSFEEKESD